MSFAAEYECRCLENSDIAAHLPYLYEQARGRQVIELGVRSGNSTAAFLAAIEADGGHLWSVDVEWPHVPEHWGESELWDFLLGDDLAPIVQATLPGKADVIFIDTSHTYDQTWRELTEYADRLVSGGVFLLHDVELERPDASPVDDPPFPVRRAVDDFAETVGWRVDYRAGCYGLATVIKPEA